MLVPNIGDIVRVPVQVYVDFPGGAWRDHFVMRNKLYRVIDFRSSAGAILLQDSSAKVMWTSVTHAGFQQAVVVKRKLEVAL